MVYGVLGVPLQAKADGGIRTKECARRRPFVGGNLVAGWEGVAEAERKMGKGESGKEFWS
jgi:hypothetical protein